MKNKAGKYIVGVVSTLVIIAISALFRSLLDKVTYFAAIDNVVRVLINELWKFLSTPTIFISILIAYIIMAFRDNIATIFPAIKEIKAGQFSATIDYLSTSEKKIIPDSSDVNFLVNNLGKITCEFLLDIDQKELTQKEMAQKIKNKRLFLFKTEKPSQEHLLSFSYGVARAFRSYILPWLGNVEISNDKRKSTFTLQPEVRKKIKSRLSQIIKEE